MVAHPKSSTRMVSKALCAMASPGSPAIVKMLVACSFFLIDEGVTGVHCKTELPE
jgi:hypothetical protein